MTRKIKSHAFPPDFPNEIAAEAFVHSDQATWRPSFAIQAVEWFGANGYAVLGTEVWCPGRDGIQSLPYFQSVDRKENESWSSFVDRAATETVTYLSALEAKFAGQEHVYINVTWASETDFQNLKKP